MYVCTAKMRMVRKSFVISSEALVWSEDNFKFIPWWVGATSKWAVDLGIVAFRRLALGQITLFDFLNTAMTGDLLPLAIIAVRFDFTRALQNDRSHCVGI